MSPKHSLLRTQETFTIHYKSVVGLPDFSGAREVGDHLLCCS
jgi:hypothetical protein